MGYRAIKRGGGGKQRDANEPEIRNALHRIGVWTRQLASVDLPDLLVWHPRTGFRLLEVKNPQGKNQISDGQAELHRTVPVDVVRSVDEAIGLFQR